VVRTSVAMAGHHDTKGRMLGWLYTGPLGHLAAGVLDWASLLARHALRRRRPDSRQRNR
jgi:hypothetical protein